MSAPEHSKDSGPDLLDALQERIGAEAGRLGTVGEIVLAETRLAGISALGLLGIALVSVPLVLLVWLLAMALLWTGLTALDLTSAAALSVLLLVHAIVLLALGLFARYLLGNLRFAHTQGALARRKPVDEAEHP